jgi:hypothetical protein
MRKMYGALSLLGIMLIVSACAKTRGEYGLMKQDLQKDGFLGEYYEKLQPGDPKIGQAEYTYNSPNAEAIARKATKVIIDPVVLFKGEKSQLDPQDAQTLVNYLHNNVYEVWKEGGWEIVDHPGPGTLRSQVALIDAESRWVALDTIATIVPTLRAVGELKGFVTGKPTFVGAARAEFKLVDTETGRIIAAGYDRRVGGRSITKGFDKWADVTNAMDYWRDLMKFRFCIFRGRPDCKAPKA